MNLVNLFKQKKQKYTKADLVIFARVHLLNDSIEANKNPHKYMKSDKNYCFIGKINEDNTVTNILTGEVYNNVTKTNANDNPYLINIGNEIFESVNIHKVKNMKIFPQYVKLLSSKNFYNDMPEFHNDSPVYKFWEKQNDSSCSVKFIASVVGDINNRVHEEFNERCYEQKVNSADQNMGL